MLFLIIFHVFITFRHGDGGLLQRRHPAQASFVLTGEWIDDSPRLAPPTDWKRHEFGASPRHSTLQRTQVSPGGGAARDHRAPWLHPCRNFCPVLRRRRGDETDVRRARPQRRKRAFQRRHARGRRRSGGRCRAAARGRDRRRALSDAGRTSGDRRRLESARSAPVRDRGAALGRRAALRLAQSRLRVQAARGRFAADRASPGRPDPVGSGRRLGGAGRGRSAPMDRALSWPHSARPRQGYRAGGREGGRGRLGRRRRGSPAVGRTLAPVRRGRRRDDGRRARQPERLRSLRPRQRIRDARLAKGEL